MSRVAVGAGIGLTGALAVSGACIAITDSSTVIAGVILMLTSCATAFITVAIDARVSR